MQSEKPDVPRPLTLKADDETAKGRYANLAQVASAHDIFVFDFAFVQGQAGWLLSRLLLNPAHAKRFHAVLGDTLMRYEARFGPIDPGPTLQ